MLNKVPHHPDMDWWEATAQGVCGICGLRRLPTPNEIVCAAMHGLAEHNPSNAAAKAILVRTLREFANAVLEKAEKIEARPFRPLRARIPSTEED